MLVGRLARIRDEWESASLQNSNTKCNGLMPIWGPSVTEATFSTCLARYVVMLLLQRMMRVTFCASARLLV